MVSTYTLGERLNCLCDMQNCMIEYSHVIDPTDPIFIRIQKEINKIINELENRDESIS